MDIKEGITMKGECYVEIRDARTGELKHLDHIKNLVVDAGKTSIASALRGDVSGNKGQITYCAVGIGENTPAANNIKLQNEIHRKQISVRSSSGKTATFKTFFNQTEAVGALKEAGLFGDLATDTKDSGTLYCRLNINRTKSANDTLTLTWMVTVG